MTVSDFAYELSNELLDARYTMKQVDETDVLSYIRVRAWKERKKKEAAKPKRRYIDEIEMFKL